MEAQSTQVLVIGGGMVGLSAALFLAWQGVQTMLVEKHPGSSLHPRAMGFTTRTMELYRAVGLGELIPQIPAGFARPRRIKVHSLAGEWAPVDLAWTPETQDESANAEPTGEISICTGAAIAQDRLEPIIRTGAIDLGADIRLSTKLVSFEQDADGVTALLRDHDIGEYSVRANYVIAADGHASPVREALGIARDGRGFLRTIRSVLFRAPLDEYLASGVSQFEITQPGLSAMMTTYRDGRWLLMFYDDEDRDEPTLIETIYKAIGRKDLPVEIITIGRWELTSLIAERFTLGRMFLAGDAAHTLPPTRGGYGANTGIEDAHNLAWKLAAVLKGTSMPELLKTYDAERIPIALLRQSQIFARADYAAFATPQDRAVPVINDEAMELGQLYRSTAVLNANVALPPALRPDQWRGQPGTRAPHVWVAYDGVRMSTLDLLQRDWVLLSEDRSWHSVAAAVAKRLNIGLRCAVLGEGLAAPQKTDILDIPIERIMAHAQGRSVIHVILPQVANHPNYETFKSMSLRQLMPLSQGTITDAALAHIEIELEGMLDVETLAEPIVAGAFVHNFGIGPVGASLVRPDGYVAWRTLDRPQDPVRALGQALLALAAARSR